MHTDKTCSCVLQGLKKFLVDENGFNTDRVTKVAQSLGRVLISYISFG